MSGLRLAEMVSKLLYDQGRRVCDLLVQYERRSDKNQL